MGKTCRYHPSFADDLSSATAYYDGISVDLGNSFRQMVRQRLATIMENPEAFGRIDDKIRASMVNRFPYVIVYEIQNEVVVMLGIHHAVSDQAGWFEHPGK